MAAEAQAQTKGPAQKPLEVKPYDPAQASTLNPKVAHVIERMHMDDRDRVIPKNEQKTDEWTMARFKEHMTALTGGTEKTAWERFTNNTKAAMYVLAFVYGAEIVEEVKGTIKEAKEDADFFTVNSERLTKKSKEIILNVLEGRATKEELQAAEAGFQKAGWDLRPSLLIAPSSSQYMNTVRVAPLTEFPLTPEIPTISRKWALAHEVGHYIHLKIISNEVKKGSNDPIIADATALLRPQGFTDDQIANEIIQAMRKTEFGRYSEKSSERIANGVATFLEGPLPKSFFNSLYRNYLTTVAEGIKTGVPTLEAISSGAGFAASRTFGNSVDGTERTLRESGMGFAKMIDEDPGHFMELLRRPSLLAEEYGSSLEYRNILGQNQQEGLASA